MTVRLETRPEHLAGRPDNCRPTGGIPSQPAVRPGGVETVPEIEHGTYRGFAQHHRAGTRPCRACLKAKSEYSRQLRQRQREEREHLTDTLAGTAAAPPPARRSAMSLRFNDDDYGWLERHAEDTGSPIRAVITAAVRFYRSHIEAGEAPMEELHWTTEQRAAARKADRLWQVAIDSARQAVSAESEVPGRQS